MVALWRARAQHAPRPQFGCAALDGDLGAGVVAGDLGEHLHEGFLIGADPRGSVRRGGECAEELLVHASGGREVAAEDEFGVHLAHLIQAGGKGVGVDLVKPG